MRTQLSLGPLFVAGLLLAPAGASSAEPRASDHATPSPTWVSVDTGTTASLRGLSALDASTAWVSGTDGTVLRTLDGGATWSRLPVAGAEELDFRDVELFDASTAVLMTAGQPARIYRSKDDGSIQLVHESPHPTAFFDGFAFWDDARGLVYSDPVEGRFLVLRTEDGGRTWSEIDPGAFPEPAEGEAGFAASGSNVAVGEDGRAWIATGGSVARVLRSRDYGQSWEMTLTPIRAGESSTGIFSLAFRDGRIGVAAGGDYLEPERSDAVAAVSSDGGATWRLATTQPPSGHRASVVVVDTADGPVWVSAGRAGCDLSRDDGRTWSRFSETGYYVLDVAADGTVWAAGSDGRVARLEGLGRAAP